MSDVDVRIANAQEVIERWNAVFETLSAEPRRQLVVSLLDAPKGETVSLPESARNPNVPVVLEELRLELIHRHLPLLAEHGFVDWQEDPFVASRGPRFDEVAVVLETIQENSRQVPDSLVIGCQRLEQERQASIGN